jgi:hypothetical protein
MGGVLKAVKGIVDMVAPIASMIPGIGMFAMAAKAAVDIGSGLLSATEKRKQQDAEDLASGAKQAINMATGHKDLAGAGNLLSSLTGGAGGGIAGALGSIFT